MASIAEAHASGSIRSAKTGSRLNATVLFWICGFVFYGAIAAHAATGDFLAETSRDIWQHLAALRALIADPFHPANPFIPTNDQSRHFHPYWVSVALLARALGWNEWQAFGLGCFLSAAVILGGIFSFGRVFYRDRRGPLALLAAMSFGWICPISHTGYHSPAAMLDGIAYPATLLIGLSLTLGALVIRALDRPKFAVLIAPLAALMFATHQLGAGIGFILAGWLAILWPGALSRNRSLALGAIGVGLLGSALWPYFNPFEAVLRTGNATWTGGFNFYGPIFLGSALVPAGLGLLGLFHRDFRPHAWPVIASLATYAGLFILGRFGVMIATRFLMPSVLMLHIGLGALFILIARGWNAYSSRRRLASFASAFAVLCGFLMLSWMTFRVDLAAERKDGSNYDPALALTRDIPDMTPVAVYDVAVWPIVATGQRAMSEPWPEPGIPDLAARQAATERLFDPSLSRDERVALAKRWGVRTLIMHRNGALRRDTSQRLVPALIRQSIRRERAGPFLRFDLY